MNRHKAVIELLLTEYGVSPSITDGTDQMILSWTLNNRLEPLMWAAEKGHEGVVKTLLDKGADIEAKDKLGQTPLWYAARNGHAAVVRQLLSKGAAVDTKDKVGLTPLSWAARNGHEAIVRQLLGEGAAVDTKDKLGLIPFFYAARNGHEAVVRLLQTHINDIHAAFHEEGFRDYPRLSTDARTGELHEPCRAAYQSRYSTTTNQTPPNSTTAFLQHQHRNTSAFKGGARSATPENSSPPMILRRSPTVGNT